MRFARFCAPSILLLLAVAYCPSAQAAPPLAGLVPFERIDADPENAYPVSAENGPWLIMATTFQGPKAAEQAKALVYELRKTYKLTAFSHRMTFDRSATIAGRRLDPYGGQQRMKNRQGGRLEEYAVLIGDFKSVDDPQAQKTLERIKLLRPQTLGGDGSRGGQVFDALRDKVVPEGQQRKKQGPMRMAFVTTNPLLPESFYHPKGVDKLVEDMNRGVKNSLLDCPGRFTMRVATFSGNVVIDPRRLQEIVEQRDEMKSRLVDAAEKAHEVAVFLRAKGYEAYEYHDRNSSIVAVGSFESPGKLNSDGSYTFSPEVQEKFDRFCAKPVQNKNGTYGPVTPMHIETLNIYLDPLPRVIEVPRRSYGSDYSRSMASER